MSTPQTSVGALRAKAQPWLDRETPERPVWTVFSTDRADRVVWEQISTECTALGELDATLTRLHGVPGLVGDLWMAAYAREPQLREAAEVAPLQRASRAIMAAQLDTPEHHELREVTVGDAYMAAMAVLAQGPALRKMLGKLDPQREQREAERAQQEAQRAAEAVAEAFQNAQDAAAAAGAGLPGDDASSAQGGADEQPGEGDNGDQDQGEGEGASDGEGQPGDDHETGGEQAAAVGDDQGEGDQGEGDASGAAADELPVPRPELVDAQRAIAEAEAADADAEAAERAVAERHEDDETGEQAAMLVRAAARAACSKAAEALERENAAMVAWGIEEGERQRLDPDTRMELARTLQTGKLAKFVDLVGRFRQMAQAQRAHRVENARSEYVGVTLGDDLTSLIPAELVNLAIPALRAQFAIRYAEKQLMIYEQRGDEHEGQGAIIVCIDCSGSMHYVDKNGITGEAYAKAFALALLDQARKAKPVREFAALLFSETVDPPIIFPADRPVALTDRIKLAADFPGGGTAFRPVLDAALALLEAEYNTTGRQRADIVFITDGVSKVGEQWLSTWRERKKRLGFRVFGIQLGYWAPDARVLDKFCDDVRRIEDLSDSHATADIFRAV